MKPFLLAAAGLFICAIAQAAAPPAGFNMDAVNTTLPEEGAPKAVPGPYAVTTEPAFGNAALKIIRPANLDAFPKKDTLPVVVWGNGGCAMETPRAAGFFETIASHGFLVVTTAAMAPAEPPAPPAPGSAPAPRRSATSADLKAGIDWAEQENHRAGSPLAGKIEMKKVAVMGQSCGGRLAIELGADPRVGTIGVFNSGVDEKQFDLLAKLHGPVLLINGGDRDFLMGMSKSTYEAIDKLPAFYGSRHGAGHTATMYHPGGGEWANVAWNWVEWQFKKDKKSARSAGCAPTRIGIRSRSG
jgi:dienelactone hydrolase